MQKFKFSLLYWHIGFNQSEADLLFLRGCVNGASLIHDPVFHIFPQTNGSQLTYEKLLCFPSLKVFFCRSDEPAPACVELTAAVFASVTASRWRSLFSSPASLAFPYSPVARLSPYSNGISTPSSKTSNKAILTPERTGNISTSSPAACFAYLVMKHYSCHLPWGSEGDLVSWSILWGESM